MPASPRDLTFISYSHKDKVWLDKLLDTLKPLVREGSVAPWEDTQIQPGDQWRKEIKQALASARVAVLLVSRDFLASDFIAKHELPALLKKAKDGGLTVLWVNLSASLYEATEIEGYQAAHDISKPLDSLSQSEQAKALVEIARKIRGAVGTKRGNGDASVFQDESQEAIKGLRPFRHEDAEIFARLGRQVEVEDCAGAITDREFRFGILSGESGCGKSSFLQAGLWPKLETYRLPHRCIYVKFANENPAETIKRAVADTLGIPEADLYGSDFLTVLKTETQTSSKPIVFLFDQFEQFFVQHKYKQDREPFIRSLSDWYREGKHLPVKVVVCIRGDFVDRLAELQNGMGYSIGPGHNFRLEKFEPKEAADVIKEIARVEGLPVEERFVEAMVRELAGRDDGLISPAYLQIMAWVIKRKKAAEEREFTSKAFQKIGGVEGLLERFLTDTLAVRQGDMARQAIIKILVALIDLDRNARVGLMTVEAIQKKLLDTLQSGEVPEAVEWLAGPGVRLVTPHKKKDVVEYELAHECLIPAVRKLAGKQLSEADQANQLLDRRVNEWLGNDRKSSYLFGWRAWRLVERNQSYLVWGQQRNYKEELLQQTKRKWNWRAGEIAIGAFVIQLTIGLFLSPWGQIQLVKWDIAKLGRGDDQSTLRVIAAGLSSAGYLERAAEAAARIVDPSIKVKALRAVSLGTAQVGDASQVADLLKQMTKAAAQIVDPLTRVQALNAVAQVASATEAAELLKEAAKVAALIKFSYNRDETLETVAQAAAQKAIATKNAELLKQAMGVIARISFESVKIAALGTVAQAAMQMGDTSQATELLKQAEGMVARFDDSDSSKVWALNELAKAAAQVTSTTKAAELLKQATEVAARLDDLPAIPEELAAVAKTAAQIASATKNYELLKLAEKVAAGIDDPSYKVEALVAVVQAARQVASITEAAELLKQATDETARIDDPSRKVEALGAMAQAAVQMRDVSQAAELLKQAVEVAARIDSPSAKFTVWRWVAQAAAQVTSATKNPELLKQIAEIAVRIDNPTKALLLGTVVQATAKLGDWRQARGYVELNTTNEGKAKSLIRILQVWHGTDEKFAEHEHAADQPEF